MKYKKKMTNIRMQRRYKKRKQHTCVELVHCALTSARLVGCALRLLLDCVTSSQDTACRTLKVSDSLSTETAPDLHVTAIHMYVFYCIHSHYCVEVCDINVLEFR